MKEKLRLSQAVIVEGKYDKIKLESVLDALILTTNGFGIFSNREQRQLIQKLAGSRGLVVVTDSDRAGFRIRGYLSGLVPPGQITHVYIPDMPGKEKRKTKCSAEGKLGVEGMEPQVLRRAFAKAGIQAQTAVPRQEITRVHLYEDGLCGGVGSSELRRRLFASLGLPGHLSTGGALPLLNAMFSLEEYREALGRIERERME